MATKKKLVDVDVVDKVLERYAEKYRQARFNLAAKEIDLAREIISEVETVDAVEVVHAHWIWDEQSQGYLCSACNNWDMETTPYCAKCGAKMDGGAGNG